MHLQPLYKGFDFVSEKDNDIAAKLFRNGLCLPSGSSLLEKEQDRIIEIIHSLTK